MQTIEAAAAYSAHGWRPIALRANDKRPMAPGWQNVALIDTMAALASTPGANIGIALTPDVIVLDIDTKGGASGFDTLTAYPALPETLSASTPSGGRHCWFKLPPGLPPVPNRVGIAPGLDIRSAGGFVVVAPSAINGRPYSWDGWDGITDPQIADAPPWLLELAQRRPTPAPTAAQGDDQIPEGCRNSTLTRTAGSLRAAGLNTEEIAAALELVNERRCSPPLDDSELGTIAASVGRYPAALEPWQVFGGQPAELPPGAMAAPTRSGLIAPGITAAEMQAANVTPDCIVKNLLFADAGVFVAPGGVGKTTVALHTSACIALGRPVFGEAVRKPGRVLILTAEDSRQILVARLRDCMTAMDLTEAERRKVMDGVRIADVSGEGFKLTEVVGDVVRPSPNVDAVIALAREVKPVLIVVDPAVSFGVGESRVNDAEQGLIDAARKAIRALNCCVLYIHHSGKQNGREGTIDQYSGRGGSAFADGSRMVLVLQPLDANGWQAATGQRLAIGETGLILARPKLSYCPPQPPIYIKRSKGFAFDHVAPLPSSKSAKLDAAADQLWQLLADEMQAGRHHSKNTAERIAASGMKRAEIRGALARLEASGRIEYRGNKTDPRRLIFPVASPTTFGEVTANQLESEPFASPTESQINFAAALGNLTWRRSSPPVLIPFFLTSPKKPGEASAKSAK